MLGVKTTQSKGNLENVLMVVCVCAGDNKAIRMTSGLQYGVTSFVLSGDSKSYQGVIYLMI